MGVLDLTESGGRGTPWVRRRRLFPTSSAQMNDRCAIRWVGLWLLLQKMNQFGDCEFHAQLAERMGRSFAHLRVRIPQQPNEVW